MDLKDQSDEDLDHLTTQIQEERNRRAEALRQERLAKCEEWSKKLTREIVDFITPEHGRTSCCDSNPCNGYYDHRNTYRCARCFLLDILESGGYYGSVPFEPSFTCQFYPERNP